MTIRYLDENGVLQASMSPQKTREECILIAQNYLDTFRAIPVAHIDTGHSIIVVSRATEWQKRNG